MKIGMQITGGAALAAALRGMEAAAAQKVVIGGLREGGELLAERMAAYMGRSASEPHAADNVVVSVVSTVGDVDGSTRGLLPDEYAVAVGPGKDFFYWFFREFGTVYQSATPAMRPAWDQSVAQCLAVLVAVLRASIEGTAARLGRGAGGGGGLA